MKLASPEPGIVIEWIHPRLSGGNDVEDSKVAVLLEDLRVQFQVFGEGLQAVRQDVSGLKEEVSGLKQEVSGLKGQVNRLEQKLDAEIEQNAREHRLNRQEHRLMMQMIQELNHDFQTQLKRVK